MTDLRTSHDDHRHAESSHRLSAGSLRRIDASVAALHDFRLLFAGASTLLLGDQFALNTTRGSSCDSATTRSPWASCSLEGLPRAAFMLIGGAMTDRFAPRRMMVAADVTRGLLDRAGRRP